MKRRILVTIDCGETKCGKCEWSTTPQKYCIIFSPIGKMLFTNGKRCLECSKAEVKK